MTKIRLSPPSLCIYPCIATKQGQLSRSFGVLLFSIKTDNPVVVLIDEVSLGCRGK
jgi:hypothetical protein